MHLNVFADNNANIFKCIYTYEKNYHHSQITNYKNYSLKCANFIITMKKIKKEFKHVNENNHMVHH